MTVKRCVDGETEYDCEEMCGRGDRQQEEDIIIFVRAISKWGVSAFVVSVSKLCCDPENRYRLSNSV